MGKRKEPKDPTADYVKMICELYGDSYDDREEDSAPGGADCYYSRPNQIQKTRRITSASF